VQPEVSYIRETFPRPISASTSAEHFFTLLLAPQH